MTNEELLGLKQECIAEEEAREKKIAEEKELPRKFIVKSSRSFFRLQRTL